jgi:formylglycine-generating enzyme required for sulfatase activity
VLILSGTVFADPPARKTTQPDGAEMILIPAGTFVYGVNQNEILALVEKLKSGWDTTIYPTEHPRQIKNLPAFYIDRYEVTNERYNRFVHLTKHRSPRFVRYPQLNAPKQPVVGVGWGDAEAYCRWSGKRLPTEVEWEKAARGTDGRTWPWGNEPDTKAYNGRGSEFFAPVEVGSYTRGNSVYGLSDMAGNVWEMTSSEWQGGRRAMRGGSFLNRLADVRVTVRWAADNEEGGANWLGFRCAMDASP